MAFDDAETRPESYMVVGAEANMDEEAQLLAPEERLEFEDNHDAHSSAQRRRVRCLERLEGPRPPRIQTIRPLFPAIQAGPADLLNRTLPRKQSQLYLLGAFLLLWLIIFTTHLSSQLPIEDGSGNQVVNLDCTDVLWRRKNECGLHGIDCRPFTNTSFSFRCPANCASVQVLNPHAVGPLDVNYRSLVIGDQVYRGDSFLCGASIHAGIASDSKGGCGRVTLVDASFQCPSDPRSTLLYVSLFFTTILSVFWTSPQIFFPIFTLIFAHVSFASDPPSASYRSATVLPDHISMFAKRLLPAIFYAIIIYRATVKRSLDGLKAPIEKTVLWLGGFFVGALSNYTFSWIPISRLTAYDLEQQPGAKVALAAILIVLAVIVVGQIYYFWLEGRLLQYLALYGLFISGILLCLTIPGVNLRIHHYIIAILLLPGTSLQTRPSLLYQGILLGLFVNGIARWDFDSVLQTANALRSDGRLDSAVPELLEPAISRSAQGLVAIFAWSLPSDGVDGISVLVNDVERHRAFFHDGVQTFKWTRSLEMQLNEYFRLAYVRNGRTLDYTDAGTLFSNGTWAIQ